MQLSGVFAATRHQVKDTHQPTAKEILTQVTDAHKLYSLRRLSFLNDTILQYSFATNSVTTGELEFTQDSLFYLTVDNIGPVPHLGADPLGEKLRRQNSDIPPLININHFIRGMIDLVSKSDEHKFLHSKIIPNETEIDVLNVLWLQTPLTSVEIYKTLNAQSPFYLASEDLQKVLTDMVKRGLLARKKISPSHEFKLSGIFSIELSAKNRKNKLFLYWPLVEKKEMITHLVSSDKYEISNLRKQIDERLHQLIRYNP